MVARLATRLDSNPNDLDGWVMLIRAYAVLGERDKAMKDKAMAALQRARALFATNANSRAEIEAQAKQSGLTP